MTWKALFENPRASRMSVVERAARHIHHGATYLLGFRADIKKEGGPIVTAAYHYAPRESWRVTVYPKYSKAEAFWIYDDHVLGARRRLPPNTKALYDGDPQLADIVDEVDRALELVGGRAPLELWVDGVVESPAHSMQEAVKRAKDYARREHKTVLIRSTGGQRRVLKRVQP